ncbi:TolB family protein [Demequina sp. NBRC 110056]|uniref:TolB family protein n=1 Tax=Demequina sp. NBRC 110056 TaxID=1570345 RepID=UPI000A02AAEF|nr:TolB family protein [Demequina sp. NBRC 110056]
MPRTHLPGQRSRLWVIDLETGERRVVLESADLLIEAPNWSPDGRDLVVNGDGRLFRIAADGSQEHLTEIDLAGVPEINNDHVLSPDGATVFVSAEDGHIYAVPYAGGSHRRVTNDRGPDFHHYLHGISPDGALLAYIGLSRSADAVVTNVFTVPTEGGQDVQLTDDAFPDDGAEFSPDGAWVYFNSERADTGAGHAQLFRMRPDGSDVEQLTHDERVNWFPHVSPDGSMMAYVSFPAGTLGHPENLDVILRLARPDGSDGRDLVYLFGGQGTINVPSWAPDSRSLAYVDYPLA